MPQIPFDHKKLLKIDLRKLAHCKMCCEPMYVIYDQGIRSYCWQCTKEINEDRTDPDRPPPSAA